MLGSIVEELRKINQKLDNLSSPKPLHTVLDVDEVAEYLKISKEKVYDLWAKRELGFVKIGTRKVSTMEQIEKYIEENSYDSLKKYNNEITVISY